MDAVEAWTGDLQDDEHALSILQQTHLEDRLASGPDAQAVSLVNRMRQLSSTLRASEELGPTVDRILESVLSIVDADTDSCV